MGLAGVAKMLDQVADQLFDIGAHVANSIGIPFVVAPLPVVAALVRALREINCLPSRDQRERRNPPR